MHLRRSSLPSGRSGVRSSRLPACTLMNDSANTAVGRSVLRIEDGPLIRGDGRFVDDLKFAGMLEAAFVRSPHAHAGIRGIDVTKALRLPGVHAVFAQADLAPLLTDER